MMSRISVCIPVYNTERFLAECLESVAAQDFDGGIEILVLSDASRGKDENGRCAKKIVRKFEKSHKDLIRAGKISIRYLENSKNRALVEVRRTLVNESSGEYIFMLDSDDTIPPNALSVLYRAASEHDADIVHGDCVTVSQDGKTHVESLNEFHPFCGTLKGAEVFESCFFKGLYRPIIASKLIRTSVYREAFEQIPYIYAHMAEEIIQYFFVARLSHAYVGIETPVYIYRQGVGITGKKITSLDEWEKVCSTASIITTLYEWAENQTVNQPDDGSAQELMHAIQRLAKSYCCNNVEQLRAKVAPELYTAAREMLCEYWGEDAIERTEDYLFHPKKSV